MIDSKTRSCGHTHFTFAISDKDCFEKRIEDFGKLDHYRECKHVLRELGGHDIDKMVQLSIITAQSGSGNPTAITYTFSAKSYRPSVTIFGASAWRERELYGRLFLHVCRRFNSLNGWCADRAREMMSVMGETRRALHREEARRE